MSVTEEQGLAPVERIERLEARTERLEALLLGAAPPGPRVPARTAAARAADRRPVPRFDERVEELVGGRLLGWVGGLAVTVGLFLLLTIASSRGWVGEEARVLMAAAAALLLIGAGAWLHERRGRPEAALAAAAAGISGLFAAIVVAGPVYDLIAARGAIVLALVAGALATALALRWSAQGIGWLGLLGALAAPLLSGAIASDAGVALLLVAYAAAGAVLLWQRWHALAGATFAVALPQLAIWLPASGQRPAAAIAALVVFGGVGAAGAAGYEWRTGALRLRGSARVLLALNALALAALGALTLAGGALSAWLAALALAHLAAALLARRSMRVTRELALTAAAVGVVLADVAFASVADGMPLVLGWAAGAVGFSALARHARRQTEEGAALTGLGAHLLLALITAVTTTAPLAAVAGASAGRGAALTAAALLAASAWAAARLLPAGRARLRAVLDAGSLAAIALLTAIALDGAALTIALAGEACVLAALARRDRADPLPFPAALAFLAAALAHALCVLAPPAALYAGLEQALPAALGCGAVVFAALRTAGATPAPRRRAALQAGAAVVALYALSVLVVTPFQPDPDLREQGQALLSGLWALIGAGVLVAGLAGDRRPLRLGALALLGVTAAKVFALDLAALSDLARVGSFVALGLLLLAAGFAWQRIRPRPLPDLRDVPGALR